MEIKTEYETFHKVMFVIWSILCIPTIIAGLLKGEFAFSIVFTVGYLLGMGLLISDATKTT